MSGLTVPERAIRRHIKLVKLQENLAAYEKRERAALDRATFANGTYTLPRIELRYQIRNWFWPWKIGIMAEIEKAKMGK